MVIDAGRELPVLRGVDLLGLRHALSVSFSVWPAPCMTESPIARTRNAPVGGGAVVALRLGAVVVVASGFADACVSFGPEHDRLRVGHAGWAGRRRARRSGRPRSTSSDDAESAADHRDALVIWRRCSPRLRRYAASRRPMAPRRTGSSTYLNDSAASADGEPDAEHEERDAGEGKVGVRAGSP